MLEDRTELLRQGLRENTIIERKYHRNLALNKNRPVLGDTIENEIYTEEFVKSKARVLKKKSLRIKEFQHLQNAFLQSEDNINAFLTVDTALYGLIRELSGNNPDLQLAAANCCCNIALGNTKACTALAKAAVPYLLATLDSVNYNLMDICIWTIGNLASGSDKAFQILYAQGCLRLLISLIQDCDLRILPSVAYATMHCIYSGYKHIDDSEMIDLTKSLVHRKNHHRDTNMIWILAILSSRNACVEYILTLIPSLVDYLHISADSEFSDVIQTTATVRILANVISEGSGKAADNLLDSSKYEIEDIKTIFDKLLRHEHVHLRKETLWLIGNLYNHSSSDHRDRTRSLISSLSSLKLAALSTGASL